ncbi:MAG: hypothetical protein V4651_09730 [Bacteroidota bacterium]
MKTLVDVVNLNADASCLSSNWWLKMLNGGKSSYFYKWLKSYVDLQKKISLGLTGATISDIAGFNPEAIDLINKNRDVFEIILRPYAHDIALLRSKEGFELNLTAGIKTIQKEFDYYTPYFLPPEFMLTNEQVKILSEYKIEGTFINAGRFKKEIKERLPEEPYIVKGIFGSELKCIPFESPLTQLYLRSIHYYTAKEWNEYFVKQQNDSCFYMWRDGESSFFLPDGNERERTWLKKESKEIERKFLSEQEESVNYKLNRYLKEKHYHHYPVHSFMAWMRESRMLGYIMNVQEFERRLTTLNKEEMSIWMLLINSDILSAVEKDSPEITILKNAKDTEEIKHVIWRCERGMEGEEWLNILRYGIQNKTVKAYLEKSTSKQVAKYTNRLDYLSTIL